ncbi:hypothetical protein Avbf_08420 [Armadillidium vulgare]|nr:hypothetical protein Avbf_08420 [Armadillidium vulgare]
MCSSSTLDISTNRGLPFNLASFKIITITLTNQRLDLRILKTIIESALRTAYSIWSWFSLGTGIGLIYLKYRKFISEVWADAKEGKSHKSCYIYCKYQAIAKCREQKVNIS